MVEDIVRIDILNHADYCGEFRKDSYIPGLRKFYQAIESVRKNNPEATLLLDAGDEINRLLWYGKDVLDGMELIGTDAWTLGNHEFDRGRKSLEDNIEYICDKIPVLCANIVEKKTGKLVKNVRPYVILERKGVRIGIIGVTTEYTEKMVTYPNFADYETTDACQAIKENCDLLKDKADIIIVLAHIGAFKKDNKQQGELIELAEKIADLPVDLLIGGHTNGDITERYSGILVNKGGFSGKSLIHTALYYDRNRGKVVRDESEVIYPLEERYDIPDERVDGFVSKVLAPFDREINEVFAKATEDIIMDYNGESAQGNLFADAVRWKAGTDFSYFNTTSCGPRIPKGDITRYIIQQAIYFNEPFCTSTITGKEIRELFETVLDPKIYSKNMNLYFSGIRVTVEKGKVVSLTREDGSEIADDDALTVATSEYMASGGNDTRKIANGRNWTSSSILIHDAIREYLTMKGQIDNSVDGRYRIISR